MLYAHISRHRLSQTIIKTRTLFYQPLAPRLQRGVHVLVSTRTVTKTRRLAQKTRWSRFKDLCIALKIS